VTLIAPGGRRTESPAPPHPQPQGPDGKPPLVGLALSPATVEQLPASVPDVRLSASARLGAAFLLVIGLLLQRTLLPSLPWGPADLVTVLVAILGLYAGPVAGCLSGFGIGFAADVLSDHALGRLAAVLCLIGYLCGMIPSKHTRRFPIVWLSVGVACVLTQLLFAVTGSFVGDTRAAGSLLFTRCIAGLAYGLILTPIVYPLTRWLLGGYSPGSRGDRRIRRTTP
jgi:rod shape-determining protein MreD